MLEFPNLKALYREGKLSLEDAKALFNVSLADEIASRALADAQTSVVRIHARSLESPADISVQCSIPYALLRKLATVASIGFLRQARTGVGADGLEGPAASSPFSIDLGEVLEAIEGKIGDAADTEEVLSFEIEQDKLVLHVEVLNVQLLRR